jgi:hypothetical protein
LAKSPSSDAARIDRRDRRQAAHAHLGIDAAPRQIVDDHDLVTERG